MRESKIENYLVNRVKGMGGEVRKVQWIGRRGAPDRLIMLPNEGRYDGYATRTVWVELKATGVAPEAYQLREHVRMRRMGQAVVVIDSLAGVDELLG
jgi:hypothetical protein